MFFPVSAIVLVLSPCLDMRCWAQAADLAVKIDGCWNLFSAISRSCQKPNTVENRQGRDLPACTGKVRIEAPTFAIISLIDNFYVILAWTWLIYRPGLHPIQWPGHAGSDPDCISLCCCSLMHLCVKCHCVTKTISILVTVYLSQFTCTLSNTSVGWFLFLFQHRSKKALSTHQG